MPNYNGKALLVQNIPPLLAALKKTSIPYEIIIPDDASTDDSISYIKQYYPEIIVVKGMANAGFSTNINRGIQAAKSEWVLALNNDVCLTESSIAALLAYTNMPQVFAIGGRIEGFDGTLQDAAKFPSISIMGIRGTYNYITKPEPTEPLLTFFCSAANVLYHREKLLALGGFNELFSPFYFEDVALGLAAWQCGWKSIYVHQSICYHPNSVTISKHNRAEYIKIISDRNKLLLNDLFLPAYLRPIYFLIQYIKYFTGGLVKSSFYQAFKLYSNLKSSLHRSPNKIQSVSKAKAEIIRSLHDKKYQIF
jgi:GT2 family glycosyltransferase